MTVPNSVANQPPAPQLRRYPKAAIFGILYLALLIVPWALTVVVNSDPFFFWKGPSRVWVYAPDIWDYRYLRQLVKGLQVADGIGTVVSLPVVAALLARCAVVYSLRRRESNKLSARQLFALADGAWSNGFSDNVASTKLSVFGAVILAATLLFPALRSGFQSTEAILLPPHEITSEYTPPGNRGLLVGEDPGVVSLSVLSQENVVGVVKDGMIALRIDDVQQTFQSRTPFARRTRRHQSIPDYTLQNDQFDDFYTTVAPQPFSTGLLRSHAICMVSSILCEKSFAYESRKPPKVCPGERPFVASFSGSNITLSICVPGRWGSSPWEATTNKQTISEEMYIVADYIEGHQPGRFEAMIYCWSNSTPGYFELPNDHNRGVAGHILDNIPSASSVGEWSSDHFPPAPSSVDEAIENLWPGSHFQPPLASGTLMTAAMALFGNGTWFEAASLAANTTDFAVANATLRALCEQDAFPFRQFEPSSANLRFACSPSNVDYSPLDDMVAEFFDAMSLGATQVMSASVFLAEEAMLKEGLRVLSSWNRQIYFMAQLKDNVYKPTLTDSAVVGLSVLLGIQAVGIALMLLYIYSQATWTEKLDALAIARITHQLDDKGAIAAMGLRALGGLERDPLIKIDGLIGVVEQSSPAIELQSMPSRSGSTGHQNEDHTGENGGPSDSQDSVAQPVPVVGNAEPVPVHPRPSTAADQRTATLPTYEEHQSQAVPPPYRREGSQSSATPDIPGLTLRVGAKGLMRNWGKKNASSV
ncbi:hypothetical protein B0T19DRAFT_284354 [Cercophora scortea]|uniref:Uncharacterized protein n=1 Tax=Cercophora scortea TaxID=314031 RepID=A0AAE0M5P3_9PEZI|nr:hypothetical protein B0T19DRAFT_284354 [Cercophora scortea]